jgi:hypothetical protein
VYQGGFELLQILFHLSALVLNAFVSCLWHTGDRLVPFSYPYLLQFGNTRCFALLIDIFDELLDSQMDTQDRCDQRFWDV